MRLVLIAALPLALAGGLTACGGDDQDEDFGSPGPAPPAKVAKGFPALRVRTVIGGLDHPWDVKPIGRGRLLVTERDRARLSLVNNGKRHTIDFPRRKVWVSGETGLLGMAVDPDFADNHRVYLCQGGFPADGGHDVHVTAWRLRVGERKVTKIKTLVGHFPTSSGRHGGCRLLIANNGALLVGTGDAAIGTNPRDLTSYGGKTLRLDRFTGEPWPTNKWADSDNEVAALHPHLRPPQRAGTHPARRRHAVVGRARARPRRRGQPPAQRRRLRLEPGPGLQRVGPDDRPVAPGQAGARRAGSRATRPWRPAAPTGCRSHGPRAGAPTAARSRSPPSRPPGSCS